MILKTEELKLGQLILCDEGGVFKTAAKVVREAYSREDCSYKVVDLEDLKTKTLFYAGGIGPYCPAFYNLEEFLSWYPPETREKLKKKLGVKDE